VRFRTNNLSKGTTTLQVFTLFVINPDAEDTFAYSLRISDDWHALDRRI